MSVRNLIIVLVILAVVFFAARGEVAMWACKNGHLDIVKFILATGLNIETKNGDGETLLHHAAAVNITSIDEVGSPASLAESRQKKKVVRYLVDRGADVNALGKGGWNVVFVAISSGDIEEFKYYLSKGADVKLKNNKGATTLMMTDNVEIAKILVEKGVDVNAASVTGLTALMLAKKPETVKFLISKGANVNAKANDGRTVLKRALDSKDYEKANLVEAAGGKK